MPAAGARRLAPSLLVLAVAAACGFPTGGLPGASPVPAGSPASGARSASPDASPVASLPADSIQHPTGARDIVLRAGQRGGFIAVEYLMGRLPEFTLYGEGRILVQPTEDAAAGTGGGGGGLNPGGGGLNPGAGGGLPGQPIGGAPLLVLHLTEAEVQQLLAFALTDGHLGIARDAYMGGIMDAPTTVFEVHAGGVDKSVLVTGMSRDPEPGPDAADLRAFSGLVDKLRSIGSDTVYAPPAYVAVIAETESQGDFGPWPWADLAPAAFLQPNDADAVPFPHHLLTAGQVAAIGVDPGAGGVSGLRVTGPDGKRYLVAVRPALPEEAPAGSGSPRNGR